MYESTLWSCREMWEATMTDDRLSAALVGTWELTLREDRTQSGTILAEPSLGSDPYGLLIYDRGGNFAAQFMKRNRSRLEPGVSTAIPAGANNTRALGGYDAYFGRYTVDDESGLVTQTLVGALSPENVGQIVTRALEVDGDTLTIRLSTTSAAGEPVERLLAWRRVG